MRKISSWNDFYDVPETSGGDSNSNWYFFFFQLQKVHAYGSQSGDLMVTFGILLGLRLGLVRIRE